jgi:Flp pilus assembly protein TadD
MLLLALLLPAIFSPVLARSDLSDQIAFGVEAARKGLWREARFRWEKALKLGSPTGRLLSNLAVACETAGDYDKAEEYYRQALRLDPGNRDIQQNHELFQAFYREFRARRDQEADRLDPAPAPAGEDPQPPAGETTDAPPPP